MSPITSFSRKVFGALVRYPLVGYLYKRFLYGLQQDLAKALAKISAVTTLVNAVIAVIAATIFYLALRPAIRRLVNTQ